MQTWTSLLPEILSSISSKEYAVPDTLRLGTDAFIVPSPDRQDLLFTFPLVIPLDLAEEISLPVSASAGAVHAIIEYCKKIAVKSKPLGLLYGVRTSNQTRYSVNIEPCTIASSRSSIASNLWRPDDQNFLTPEGIRLSVRGAIPFYPITPSHMNTIRSLLMSFLESLVDCVHQTPILQIKRHWEAVSDQHHLREELQEKGLVCFIGDGTKPARSYTRHRSWHRVAGPKDGVNIPFYCPKDLFPIEFSLKGSNRSITGLGIRQGEILAITGSNAEGKSTLLSAIQAGEDDHAPGDGREMLVTVPGGSAPDATNIELMGADLRPFFEDIPPGMSGTPESVFGQGSGSASLAYRFSDALRKQSPYIILDEDRIAQNLMVPCYMTTSAVTPLATLVKKNRDWLSGTSLIIGGSGMELLIAQADRIIKLHRHQAYHEPADQYREGLRNHYQRLSEMIP